MLFLSYDIVFNSISLLPTIFSSSLIFVLCGTLILLCAVLIHKLFPCISFLSGLMSLIFLFVY